MAASLGPSPWTHLQVVPSAHRSCGRASRYSRNLGISMGIFKVDVSKKLADLKKKLKFSWFLKLIYIVSKSLVDFWLIFWVQIADLVDLVDLYTYSFMCFYLQASWCKLLNITWLALVPAQYGERCLNMSKKTICIETNKQNIMISVHTWICGYGYTSS